MNPFSTNPIRYLLLLVLALAALQARAQAPDLSAFSLQALESTLNTKNQLVALEFVTNPALLPGQGTVVAMSGTANRNVELPTASLRGTSQQLWVRAQTAGGQWSQLVMVQPITLLNQSVPVAIAPVGHNRVSSFTFYAGPASLTDPEGGQPVPLSGTQTSTASIYTDKLGAGAWPLYYQPRFADGSTGPIQALGSIAKDAPIIDPVADLRALITRYEYFFGPDPGVGKATQVSYQAGEPLLIPVNDLALGQHTVGIRFVDARQRWSHTATATFTVQAGQASNYLLVAPQPNDIIYTNQPIEVQWLTQQVVDSVYLRLYNSEPNIFTPMGSIKYNPPKNGLHSLTYKVPHDFTYRNQEAGQITIRPTNNAPQIDIPVTVKRPSVGLQPLGITTIQAGETLHLQWQTEGVGANDRIRLTYKNDDQNLYGHIAYAENTGEFFWKVPGLPNSSDYRILAGVDGFENTIASERFSIQSVDVPGNYAAIALPVGQLPFTATGNTAGFTNDFPANQAESQPGADVYYQFTTPMCLDELTLTLQVPDSSYGCLRLVDVWGNTLSKFCSHTSTRIIKGLSGNATYYVVFDGATDGIDYTFTLDATTVSVAGYNGPVVDVKACGSQVLLDAAVPNGGTYSWYAIAADGTSTQLPNQTRQTLNITQEGTYQVLVEKNTGCSTNRYNVTFNNAADTVLAVDLQFNGTPFRVDVDWISTAQNPEWFKLEQGQVVPVEPAEDDIYGYDIAATGNYQTQVFAGNKCAAVTYHVENIEVALANDPNKIFETRLVPFLNSPALPVTVDVTQVKANSPVVYQWNNGLTTPTRTFAQTADFTGAYVDFTQPQLGTKRIYVQNTAPDVLDDVTLYNCKGGAFALQGNERLRAGIEASFYWADGGLTEPIRTVTTAGSYLLYIATPQGVFERTYVTVHGPEEVTALTELGFDNSPIAIDFMQRLGIEADQNPVFELQDEHYNPIGQGQVQTIASAGTYYIQVATDATCKRYPVLVSQGPNSVRTATVNLCTGQAYTLDVVDWLEHFSAYADVIWRDADTKEVLAQGIAPTYSGIFTQNRRIEAVMNSPLWGYVAGIFELVAGPIELTPLDRYLWNGEVTLDATRIYNEISGEAVQPNSYTWSSGQPLTKGFVKALDTGIYNVEIAMDFGCFLQPFNVLEAGSGILASDPLQLKAFHTATAGGSQPIDPAIEANNINATVQLNLASFPDYTMYFGFSVANDLIRLADFRLFAPYYDVQAVIRKAGTMEAVHTLNSLGSTAQLSDLLLSPGDYIIEVTLPAEYLGALQPGQHKKEGIDALLPDVNSLYAASSNIFKPLSLSKGPSDVPFAMTINLEPLPQDMVPARFSQCGQGQLITIGSTIDPNKYGFTYNWRVEKDGMVVEGPVIAQRFTTANYGKVVLAVTHPEFTQTFEVATIIQPAAPSAAVSVVLSDVVQEGNSALFILPEQNTAVTEVQWYTSQNAGAPTTSWRQLATTSRLTKSITFNTPGTWFVTARTVLDGCPQAQPFPARPLQITVVAEERNDSRPPEEPCIIDCNDNPYDPEGNPVVSCDTGSRFENIAFECFWSRPGRVSRLGDSNASSGTGSGGGGSTPPPPLPPNGATGGCSDKVTLTFRPTVFGCDSNDPNYTNYCRLATNEENAQFMLTQEQAWLGNREILYRQQEESLTIGSMVQFPANVPLNNLELYVKSEDFTVPGIITQRSLTDRLSTVCPVSFVMPMYRCKEENTLEAFSPNYFMLRQLECTDGQEEAIVKTGTATYQCSNCYRLTCQKPESEGRVWLDDVNLTRATNEFIFSLNYGSAAGNGMAFVLAAEPNTAFTDEKGHPGYAGIGNSLVIEFDLEQNSNDLDPVFAHIAMMKNGTTLHAGSNQLVPPLPLSVTPGQLHEVTVRLFHDTTAPEGQAPSFVEVLINGTIVMTKALDITEIIGGQTAVWGITATNSQVGSMQQFCLPGCIALPTIVVKE